MPKGGDTDRIQTVSEPAAPLTFMAAAMFTSGKSHVLRSATFSK
jgi:hypothetical protein